jgi:hypothetical protein
VGLTIFACHDRWIEKSIPFRCPNSYKSFVITNIVGSTTCSLFFINIVGAIEFYFHEQGCFHQEKAFPSPKFNSQAPGNPATAVYRQCSFAHRSDAPAGLLTLSPVSKVESLRASSVPIFPVSIFIATPKMQLSTIFFNNIVGSKRIQPLSALFSSTS